MTQRPNIVSVVHTSFVPVDSIESLFEQFAPEIVVRHIVDDSLLPEVLANAGVTPAVESRLIAYFQAAEASGCDLIFSSCSSVGEVVDVAAQQVSKPIIKIDSRMCERACETGGRVGLVATLATTIGPTRRLLEATARAMSKSVEVEDCLVAGAFDRLSSGDSEGHDHMLIEAIHELAERVDVVVCAQGSMASVQSRLGPMKTPVLTSPRLGVSHAIDVLGGRVTS